MNFAEQVGGLNIDMVYTIGAYHDVGISVDRDEHERISSELLLKDQNLRAFFNDEEMKVMAEAVYDHRGSLKYIPRSIYGKIISSADRNNSVSKIFKRTYKYGLKNFPNLNLNDQISRAFDVIEERYGENGVSAPKMYFKDEIYESFLEEIRALLKNKEEFKKRFLTENGLENKK